MAANALTINLLLRAKQFERQMGKVARVMERVKKRAEKVAVAARKMFLVSAAAATAATVSFARFENRMARVGALSSATKTQLEELSKVARQLGKETQFSFLDCDSVDCQRAFMPERYAHVYDLSIHFQYSVMNSGP